MAVRRSPAVQRLSSATRWTESCPGRIGPISLEVKQMGARSARRYGWWHFETGHVRRGRSHGVGDVQRECRQYLGDAEDTRRQRRQLRHSARPKQSAAGSLSVRKAVRAGPKRRAPVLVFRKRTTYPQVETHHDRIVNSAPLAKLTLRSAYSALTLQSPLQEFKLIAAARP